MSHGRRRTRRTCPYLAFRRLDALARAGEQWPRPPRALLRAASGEVRQQAEVQIGVAVGQEAHLERLDAGRRCLGAGRASSGRRPACAMSGGMPSREVHPRQRVRRHEQRGQPVDDAHGELAGAERQRARRGSRAGTSATPSRAACARRAALDRGGDEPRWRRGRGAAASRAGAPAQRFARREAHPRAPLERADAPVDQVVADVGVRADRSPSPASRVARWRAGSPCAPPRVPRAPLRFAIASTTWR